MLPFLACVILLFSCQKSSDQPVPQESAKVITMQADQTDEKLAQIAEDARNTLPGFFRQLTRADVKEEHFCIKYPFKADEDSGINMEQVWLTGIHFKNGIYYGFLASAPQHLSGMKKGDKVMFDTDTITDWMYVRGGRIIGGDSIKYLLKKTPEDQRSDEERELLRMLH
jgi:uncharacterized protein YegJ (DUF2314 family)